MSDEFNHEEFDKRIHQEYETYQASLQHTHNKKETALMQANYFQNCLKDSMENILQSKEARRIPIKVIVSILSDRGILSSEKAKDAMKICDIRDWFAHRVNLKSIEEDAEKLIHTINVQVPTIENTTNGKENTDIVVHVDKESNRLDLYERLDLVCSNLSRTVKNGFISNGNKPKINYSA
jgi:hypothetical protein